MNLRIEKNKMLSSVAKLLYIGSDITKKLEELNDKYGVYFGEFTKERVADTNTYRELCAKDTKTIFAIKYTRNLSFDDMKEILPQVADKDVSYNRNGIIRLEVLKGEEKVGEVFYSENSEEWVFDRKWNKELCDTLGRGVQTGFVNFSSCVERDSRYSFDVLIAEVEYRIKDILV